MASRAGGGLDHAEASIETPYVRAAIAWRRASETITVEVEAPPGALGRFEPPVGEVRILGSGRCSLTVSLPR